MKNTLFNITGNDGFFTLMECMTALAIFCALVALAIPRFTMQMEKARAGEAVQTLETLLKYQRAYYHEYKAYTNSLNNLDITPRVSNYFNTPTLATADPIVSVQRSDGSYTLRIATTGAITCIPAGGTCGNLGY